MHDEKEIAGDMLEPKLYDITLNFPIPYENNITIESDSKQRMMTYWNWAESVLTETKQEIQTPLCTWICAELRPNML